MCWAPLKLNDTPPPGSSLDTHTVLWQLTTDIAHSWCFEPLCLSHEDLLVLKALFLRTQLDCQYIICQVPACLGPRACSTDNHRVNRSDPKQKDPVLDFSSSHID